MIARFKLGPASKVMEIASNDGYLLQHFVARSVPALGIEPAANVAKVAIEKGVPSTVRFFGRKTAAEIAAEHGRPDVLLGNNVLAHVPDINDFVGGMKVLLAPHGVITMEFPHLQRLIAENQFDTIYHEHWSYLSLGTTQRIFASHGMTIFDVEELASHGGSLRLFVRHTADHSKPVTPRVAELLAREEAFGLFDLATYRRFSDQVKETKRALLDLLIDIKNDGRTIAIYGAAGKGNTLLNYCGIGTDFIDFASDRTPYKHGRFTPGTHIPIHPPEMIEERKPDYVLILPWNLKKEIMAQLAYIGEWGGRFIVPIPKATVYEAGSE